MSDLEPKFWQVTNWHNTEGFNYTFQMYYYNIPDGEHREFFSKASSWCIEQFGQHFGYHKRWDYGDRSLLILIRDETDAIAFKMRWC